MRVKRLGVLAVSALLMLGLATPASAKAKTFSDRKGDVVATKDSGDMFTAMPPDIVKVAAGFDNRWLTVAVTLTTKAAKGWDNLRINIDSYDAGDADYRVDVNAKDGKITDAGMSRWSDSDYSSTSDVRVSVKGKTITVNASIGDWIAPRASIGFSVSIARYLKKDKSSARIDDFPSRIRSQGTLDMGPMVYQSLARGRSNVPQLKQTDATVALAAKTIKKGAAPKVKIAVKQKLAGTAMIYDGYDVVKMVRVAKGKKKTVKLAKQQRVGSHTFKVRFFPDALAYAPTSDYVVLTVKK